MPNPSAVPTLAIVGAGGRGGGYARLAKTFGEGRVVAVAEPRAVQREAIARDWDLPADAAVDDWRVLAERGRVADAVVIGTQDRDHVEPAIAFARQGYHILLEKPMATTEEDCRRIVEAVEQAGVILAVGHVMRYTRYTQALKRLIDAGRIGDVVSVEHLEPVGWWHYAHSFVRGNWRREDTSMFMLMTKSCHDIDWLAYIIGRPALRTSSFGSLTHFRPEHQPAGATDRCLTCPVEPTCPYSAKRLYFGLLERPDAPTWPLTVITDDYTEAGVTAALRDGPYGRCVYTSDNDVVDHQVVNLEYAGGVTASFTMTAFSPMTGRKTRIFGTRGSIEGDGQTILVHDFVTATDEVVDPAGGTDPSAAGGHGGGDGGLLHGFLHAIATGDRSGVLSGPRESLDSHLVVFAAEQARRSGTVVSIAPTAAAAGSAAAATAAG